MKQRLFFFVATVLWLCQMPGFAQRIKISQPFDGAVYQQNAQGSGRVIIRGDFNSYQFLSGNFYILIGRLQKLNLASGEPTTDAPIEFPIRQQRTTFAQEVNAPKGWYQLSITAYKVSGFPFGPRVFTSSVKVGIGEVFVIAGQSNAQGGHGVIVLPDDQKMDAVRVMDYSIPDFQKADFRTFPNMYREIRQLKSAEDSRQIGPLGSDLWYWASVGAQLSRDCGVPVALFNAGYGGTTITQWATSTNPNARASGQYAPSNINSPTADRYQPGAPYGFFGNMLQLYASTYGIRAVLWMQGETDTKAIIQSGIADFAGSWADRPLFGADLSRIAVPPFNLPSEPNEKLWVRNSGEYATKLAGVIAKSRTEVPGRTIPWVIAQTSYIGADYSGNEVNRFNGDRGGITSSVVTNGQLISAIGSQSLVQMSSTDDLKSDYRILSAGPDWPVHFNAIGATTVASRWASKLIEICRDNLVPPITQQDLGTEPIALEISDDNQSAVAPDGYSSYKWLRNTGFYDENAPVAYSQAVSAGVGGASLTKVSTKNVNSANTTVQPGGTYQAVLRTGSGLPILSQAIDLPYTIVDDTGDNPPSTCALPANACYTIHVLKTGLRLQAMGDNYVQQQNANNQTNQVWKAEDRGNGRLSFTVQDGTNRTIRAANGANNGEWLTLSPYAGNGQQDWSLSCNPDNNGLWRVSYPANNNTWDLNNFGNSPQLQIWGNTSEPFYDYRSFIFNPATCPNGTTTPPPTPNPPGSFALNAPNYDCQTGALRINTTAGNGSAIEYMISGLRGWGSSPDFTVPSWQLQGTSFTLMARQSGQEISLVFTTGCGNTPPPTNPPPTSGGGALVITQPTMDCGTGNLTVNVSGGNGTAIEYMAGGLRGWETSNILNVPSWQRSGTTFTLKARQAGTEVSRDYTTGCSGGRIARLSEETARLRVSPNPTRGLIRVQYRLATGERGRLQVVSMSGQIVAEQDVVGTGGDVERELSLDGQVSGLYLLKLSGPGIAETVKVLLQR